MAKVLKSIILKYIFIDIHLFDSDQTSKSQNQAKYVLWTETTKHKCTFQSILAGNWPTWRLEAVWKMYLLVVFVCHSGKCWD